MSKPNYLCYESQGELVINRVVGETEKYWKITTKLGAILLINKRTLLLHGTKIQYVSMTTEEVNLYRYRQSLISKFNQIKSDKLSNEVLETILTLVHF